MIEVGQQVRFDAFKEYSGFCSTLHDREAHGVVVYINHPHKWFTVEFGNPKQRTAFKFSQIGKDVTLCGH